MKIYTKTGDSGETGLFGGPRVSKAHLRIEAYGTVDELNALLGVVQTEGPPSRIAEVLTRVQHELFVVGAELASPDVEKLTMPLIGELHIGALEQTIDQFEEALSPLRQFILPGGSRAAAALHLARTVCRRAERRVVALRESALRESALRESGHRLGTDRVVTYLNRLGDLLFVLARAANASAGQPDVPWLQPG